MDKRFFLALFLSLVVIAVSQLLFPPKPAPRNTVAKDSTSVSRGTASSTTQSVPEAPVTIPAKIRTGGTAPSVIAAGTAETTTVSTPKAIYKFSNVGATPASVVMRDYKSGSPSNGLVDLAVAGFPLLGYRLVTPTDTADLSQVPFSLSRTRDG